MNTLSNKKSGGAVIEAYNYGYDNNGNIVTKLDGKGTTSYTYDKLDRVLIVTEPSGKKTTYTYNTAGDRATETVVTGGTTVTKTYSYNSKGWLTSVSEVNGTTTTVVKYTYDANGNQMSKMKEVTAPAGGSASGSLSNESDYAAYYVYDMWNNMTQSVSGTDTSDYYYDGDGLRYGKRVNGGDMTVSLYEYDDVILEINGTTGAQTAINVYGNQLISRNGQSYMYNGHGDITAILDASSNVVASYYYDAFGVHLSTTGSANNPYRYSGYMFDEETGLYYLKSRYYDAETARFISEDTYRGSASDPLSLNLYAYVKYNPLKYIDPTGHEGVIGNIDGTRISGMDYTDGVLTGQITDVLNAFGASYIYHKANNTTTVTINGVSRVMPGNIQNRTASANGRISLSDINAGFGTSYYISSYTGGTVYISKPTNTTTTPPTGGGSTGGNPPSGNTGNTGNGGHGVPIVIDPAPITPIDNPDFDWLKGTYAAIDFNPNLLDSIKKPTLFDLPKELSLSGIDVNSDTYKIIQDLRKRYLDTPLVLKGELDKLVTLAIATKRNYDAGTPYIYAQDKIMNELHRNAEIALEYIKNLSKDLFRTYSKEEFDSYFAATSSYLMTRVYDPNIWNYKYQDEWRIPEEYLSKNRGIFDDYDMKADPNGRNWRPFMYFDGEIISADYFGNLNMAYVGTKMGLSEIIWNNFSTQDDKRDIRAMDYGRKMALDGR